MISTSSIQPKEILAKLSSLSEKLQSSHLTRACLFNLIVYAKKDGREAYLYSVARSIIRKFPCRLIFITEEENPQESFLSTYVCDLRPEGESSTFCDMIHFDVGGEHTNRIPFVILPHLIADLPVYLLSGDETPLTHALQNNATRTIFDSECTQDFSAFTKRLLAIYRSNHADIGDLNWARTASWRSLFSHTFSTPEKLSSLLKAKELTIQYNQEGHAIPSLYFQGWLATRLKWHFESKTDSSYHYVSPQGPVTVHLLPTSQKSLPHGRIVSVSLKSYDNEEIRFQRQEISPETIQIRYTSLNSCELPILYKFTKEHSGPSIVHEIYNVGTSPTFLKVLQFLSTL